MSPARLVRSAVGTTVVRNRLVREPVRLIAAGKATAGMVDAFAQHAQTRIAGGVAVGPGPPASVPPGVRWYTGGHPLPDRASLAAGRAALVCAGQTPSTGALVVLLSGGASALMAVPIGGVTFAEKIEATQVLLAAGVPIHELNCVRKHLSAIKGGHLALATPGPVVTLAISDVVAPVADDPGVIGSGPTVPDDTSYADALAIVTRAGVRERMPASIIDTLRRGARGEVPETMTSADRGDRDDLYRVIGNRGNAMAGAEAAARRLGYDVATIGEPLVGAARAVGAAHPTRARAAIGTRRGPVCVISSGETTVKVTGRGRGGRNQEVALAAVPHMHHLGPAAVLASVGTDGVDGPTDAAGALVDGDTERRARAAGLGAAEAYLADNDSYAYFEQLGDLIRTGPSGTNVGDLQVVLTDDADMR